VKKPAEQMPIESPEKHHRSPRKIVVVEEKSKRGRWITLIILTLSILISWLFSL